MAKLTPVKLRQQADELIKKAELLEAKTYEQIGKLVSLNLKRNDVTVAELKAKVKEILGE